MEERIKNLRKEFEGWFGRLLVCPTTTSYGCFMRDVLRGRKQYLWREYLRLIRGGKPFYEGVDYTEAEKLMKTNLHEKEYEKLMDRLDTLRDHFKNNNIPPLDRSQCLTLTEECLEILDPGGEYIGSL